MRSYSAFHYLFRNDSVKKAIKIYYYNGSGTSNLTNSYVSSESFEYEQCLCDEEQLEPGQCNASWIKFKLGDTPANFPSNMVGKWVRIDFIPDRKQNLTLGTYYCAVDTIDEQGFRTITAYDRLSQILNAELIDWYNGLFPDPETDSYTLKQFRDSLFTYLGVTQVSTTLVNDSMIVKKTVEATSLSGKDVLEAICQLNGVWGQMNSDNYFKYVSLASVIWTVGINGKYMEEEHEDYVSDVIDKVQIRGSENDVGAIVGSGTNALVVQGNFLTFGMSSADLTTVATNLLNKVDDYQVKPFKLTIPGDPVLECGDGVKFTPVGGTQFTAYILKRKLTGIQAMTDVLEARCNKTRSERITSTNYQLMQIMGKTNELTRTVEETQSTITQILDPTDPTSLQSQITQNAQAITLKVSKGEVSSEISQEAGQITISSNRLVINSTGFTLDANGRATFGSEDTANKLAILDVNDQSTYLIRAQKLKTWSDSQNEWRDSFSVDKDGLVKCQKIEFISTYGTNYIGTDGFTIYGNSFVYGALQVNSLTTNGTNGNITIQGTGTSSCSGKFESKQFAFKNASLSDSYFDGEFKVHDTYGTLSITSREISAPNTLTIKSANSTYGVVIGSNGGRISFFGGTVHAKDTVNKLYSSASLSDVITKVNALLTALSDYNLINSV